MFKVQDAQKRRSSGTIDAKSLPDKVLPKSFPNSIYHFEHKGQNDDDGDGDDGDWDENGGGDDDDGSAAVLEF